jgi:hypothetical protein
MAEHRRLVVAAGAALVLALLLIRGIPYLTQQREVIAATPTPNAVSAVTPVPLPSGSTACLTQVTFSPQAQVARFVTYGTPGAKVSPLVVTAAGGNYKTTSRLSATYPSIGTVEVPIRPAKRPVIGQLCIRNKGPHGITLAGTAEGRTVGRSLTGVDGKFQIAQVSLTLRSAKPAALGSRIGALFRHASALNPTSPLFIWVLALAVLTLVPLAVFWALSTALAAGESTSLVADAAPLAVPLARPAGRARRRVEPLIGRVAAVPGWVWLTALVLVASVWLLRWGIRTHSFQNDEARNIYLSRWIDTALPGSLWDFTFISTGLQRLSLWLMAPVVGLFGGPDWARVGHALNSLLFASTAIPVYLIVRGLRLPARWAVLAAVLTVAVPWAVVATSFLTEPVAYPAFAFALWAIWRSVVKPGWRTDALAVVLVVVAGLARVNLLALGGALALGVVIQELRFGEQGSLRRRLFAFVRVHAALVGVAALVLFVVLLSATGLVSGTDRIAGFYGLKNRFHVPTTLLTSKLDVYTTRFIAGFAFVPFVFGLAWGVRTLVRPRDPERFGYALVGTLAIAAIIYTSAGAGFDERYIIYYAPVFAVAFVAALARRETPPVLVGAAGLVGALLLLGQEWSQAPQGAYSWFVSPAETIYANVALGRIAHDLPNHDPRSGAFVLTLGLVGLCVLAASRHRWARTLTGLLIAGVVAIQLFQTQDALSKYVNGAGSAAAASDSQRSWVDASLYGKSQAAVLAVGPGNSLPWDPIWTELQFWNDSVTQVASVGPRVIQVPLSDPALELNVDAETGRLTGGQGLAPYVVVPRIFLGLGLDTQVIRQAPYLALDLAKLRTRQVQWKADGQQLDGFMNPGQPVRMRVYRGLASSPAPACAVALVTAPDGLKSRVSLAQGRVARGQLVAATHTARIELPLRWHGQRYLDLSLTSTGKVKLPDGRVQSAQISGMAAGPCLHPAGG